MGIGLPEIAILLVILLVVFGAKKLPELGKGLGSGMREFKDGISGDEAKKPQQLSANQTPAAPVQPAPQAETSETATGVHPDPDAPGAARTKE